MRWLLIVLLVACKSSGHPAIDGPPAPNPDAPPGDAPPNPDAPIVPPDAPSASCVVVDGVGPTPVCADPATADPDGDGWGWENNASCIVGTSATAQRSPYCDTPASPPAYEAPAATVTDTTTSVATIPRPPHVTVGPLAACPYDDTGLTTVSAAWITNGTLAIPAGTRAILHGNAEIPSTTLLRMVDIPASSELIFADQPTQLRITDMHVSGALRLGSPTCRLQSAIAITFDTDEDVAQAATRTAIYNRIGLGIMVDDGAVFDVFGKLYQPTWTRLAATAAQSATTIALAETVDWEVGAQIVIATSSRTDYPFTDENEVRTITATTGTTLTLDAPLAHAHYGGAEYQVEVGLLTHNIAFATSAGVLAAAPTFGGHIMIHSKTARVSGISLTGMGQQNFLGRYPLHFHHAGDVMGGSYFTDSSIVHSNWRCAVVHRTDRALVSRDVAYDTFGHCFYLEDGVEMNNEISFDLAVRPKILGPTDQASMDALKDPSQTGFTLDATPALSQPADRAAAGFYITNGNNKIVGNASSGGFAGYSFPSLPVAIGGSDRRIFPIRYGVSHFDGNTAHSTGYIWPQAGGLYIGGVLTEVDDGTGTGTTHLRYLSGRTTDFFLLRHQTEVFNNTKTFLAENGITHWGNGPRIVNFEAWDDALLAQLFGAASIQSALVSLHSANPASATRPLQWWSRGFQFYDTRTQTILRDVIFRNFHPDPTANTYKDWDSCALVSMTHSDQYTPQQMNSVAGLHFANVDDTQRICVGDHGTLSSRNFNVLDTDGSMTRYAGDGLPATGARLVGSAYVDTWRIDPATCKKHDAWGTWTCPAPAAGVASVGIEPDANVHVKMYRLDNTQLGETWYSATDFVDAQITGPAGIGWHHSFPSNNVPDTFDVQTIQVPDGSFVLLSFSLPAGVACSVAGWTAAADVTALLASTGAGYTTAQNTCFVRIPPTNVGSFSASGMTVQNMTWRGNPTPTTYFTVTTGCTAANAACKGLASTVPTL